jgi:hypothetical protein
MAEMTFWERLRIAWATFRRTGGLELPDAGRSSEETLSGYLSAYLGSIGSVSPVIDFTMLECLKKLWLYNPDISQYVANIVNLGNPGHTLSVDARNDSVAEAAVERLNESASRIYRIGVGVDGLINQYLTSIAWSGAVSSEDVVNFAAGRVEKVVLVPVEQIRFRYNNETDDYDPYQRALNLKRRDGDRDWLGMIRLNSETYKYYALSTVENSPYAKPPATAAVEAILEAQKPIMENIRFMAQKVGLLGLVAVGVAPPAKRGGESENEYQARAKTYLKAITESLDGNFNKGLVVTYRDQAVEHTSVSGEASGVYEINRISEEQIMSAVAMPPVFFGRTDSSTETFADVVYSILVAQTANMQRLPKRRMERTYRLDLRLGGIDVDGVSLTFNKAHSRNAKDDAATDAIKLKTVIDKVNAGLISPDEGAQELGYETWFDEDLIDGELPLSQSQGRLTRQNKRRTLTLTFDKRSQRYRYQPERIEIWSGSEEEDGANNVVPIIKKKALHRASN